LIQSKHFLTTLPNVKSQPKEKEMTKRKPRGNSSGNQYRPPTGDRLGQLTESQRLRHWWFN
jgi:hypothetical protein